MLSVQENERLTQVGSGTPMGNLLRRYWHPIAASVELDREPTRAVRLLGEELVLYKDRGGVLGLVQQACAHRRVNLLYGIPEQHGLRCAYHGWLYDETGQCLEQPAEAPDSTFKDRVRITAYPVQELGGLVFAYLGPEPVPLLPRWDLLVREDLRREIGLTVVDCNWLQCMENSHDPCHTEWLHGYQSYFLMEQAGKEVPRTAEGRYAVFRHMKIGFERFEYGIIKRRLMEGQSEEHDDWRIGHPVLFPNTLRLGVGGGSFEIRVPMDDTHTRHFKYDCRPLEPGAPRQEEVPVHAVEYLDASGRATRDSTLPQDMMAWWSQGPVAQRWEERLAESDKGIILYRRLLQEQMAIVEDGGEPMNVFRDPAKNESIQVMAEQNQYMVFPSAKRQGSIKAYRNTRYTAKR